MTGPDLVANFYDLNLGIYFDQLADIKFAKIYTSDLITDEFNNHALVYNFGENLPEKLEKIENYLKNKGRNPSVYITPHTLPNDCYQLVEKSGYTKSFHDVYMEFDTLTPLPEWEAMKSVVFVGQDERLISEFKKVSQIGFSGEKSLENPYGGISMEGFIAAAERALKDEKSLNKFEAHLIIHKGEFVACGALLHDTKTGYLCNIASIPKVRGQGFGKIISQYLTKRSTHLGMHTTFLATELGSTNESFYQHIGYSSKYEGVCYVKKQ